MAPLSTQDEANGGLEVVRDPPAASSSRVWDDIPLRNKLTLLVMLAAVGGGWVGIAESRFGHELWPFVLGITVLVVPLLLLGQRWVCGPFDKLERQINLIRFRRRAAMLRQLPVMRCDEVGRLARAVHEVAEAAIRDRSEASRLRRTIDDRIARATRRATSRLRQIAVRDPLTNLANRRFLQEHLEPLVQSVQQAQADLVCVLLDMDNFKQVNDRLGHAMGDRLLALLAGLIRGCIRSVDFAVRYGGDEILVLMPNCPIDRARSFASRLINLFDQQVATVVPEAVGCSLSIGIATLQGNRVSTGQELIEKADFYLYEAKRGGKGLVIAGDPVTVNT